jgi:hypothetical protein
MTSTATKYKELPLDEQVRIVDKFGEVKSSYDSFILARALYIAEARLNGKDDVTIAREITVEYRDSGAHMRQIRESLGIE